MKHFISKDKYINSVIANVVGLPDTSFCPFTISVFAKAFNISRTTAAKRISQNKDIIEVSHSGETKDAIEATTNTSGRPRATVEDQSTSR